MRSEDSCESLHYKLCQLINRPGSNIDFDNRLVDWKGNRINRIIRLVRIQKKITSNIRENKYMGPRTK